MCTLNEGWSLARGYAFLCNISGCRIHASEIVSFCKDAIFYKMTHSISSGIMLYECKSDLYVNCITYSEIMLEMSIVRFVS